MHKRERRTTTNTRRFHKLDLSSLAIQQIKYDKKISFFFFGKKRYNKLFKKKPESYR